MNIAARAIPIERAPRYIALFFLGGAASVVSILYGKLPGAFDVIFLFIPPSLAAMGEVMGLGTGLAGIFRPLATAANFVFAFMLARYGIQGIMAPGHKRRLLVLGIVAVLGVLSGSRLALVSFTGGVTDEIDEVRVGTAWADVVPEPASASVLLLASACALLRRRSRSA